MHRSCRTGKYSVSRSHVPGILQCPENTASFHQIPSQSWQHFRRHRSHSTAGNHRLTSVSYTHLIDNCRGIVKSILDCAVISDAVGFENFVQFFLFDLLRLVKRVECLALIKVTAPLIRFHINWLRVGCVDDRIGMNFCDVVSDDFKWHGDHLLSWDL